MELMMIYLSVCISMMEEARRRHDGEELTTCSTVKSWPESFTLSEMKDKYIFMFWYNVGRDTRAITREF